MLRTLEINGAVYRVELLESEWERYEIVMLAQTAPTQALTVVLGRCLPDLELQREWIRCRGNPVVYGPKVGDAMLARGINPAQIAVAGQALIEALTESLVPSQDEVEETRGNSPPPTAAPTA